VFAFVLVVAGAAAAFLAAGAAAFLVVVEAFVAGAAVFTEIRTRAIIRGIYGPYLRSLLLLSCLGSRLLLNSRLLLGLFRLLRLCWRRGSLGVLFLCDLHWSGRALGTEEVTGLLTTGEGAIEVLDERRVGGRAEILVGLNIFLNGLAAGGGGGVSNPM